MLGPWHLLLWVWRLPDDKHQWGQEGMGLGQVPLQPQIARQLSVPRGWEAGFLSREDTHSSPDSTGSARQGARALWDWTRKADVSDGCVTFGDLPP